MRQVHKEIPFFKKIQFNGKNASERASSNSALHSGETQLQCRNFLMEALGKVPGVAVNLPKGDRVFSIIMPRKKSQLTTLSGKLKCARDGHATHM